MKTLKLIVNNRVQKTFDGFDRDDSFVQQIVKMFSEIYGYENVKLIEAK